MYKYISLKQMLYNFSCSFISFLLSSDQVRFSLRETITIKPDMLSQKQNSSNTSPTTELIPDIIIPSQTSSHNKGGPHQ